MRVEISILSFILDFITASLLVHVLCLDETSAASSETCAHAAEEGSLQIP